MTVGGRPIDVTDAAQGMRVPMWLLDPAREVERIERFGMSSPRVALDEPVDGDRIPLVGISHDTGRTPWVMRDLDPPGFDRAAYLLTTGSPST